MFKVDREKGKYTIRIGDGKRGGYRNNDAAQVALALRHYYENDHNGHPVHYCPLCNPEGG